MNPTIDPTRTDVIRRRLLQAVLLLIVAALIVAAYVSVAWLDTSLHTSMATPQGYSNSQVFGQVAKQFAARADAQTTADVRPVLHVTVPDNGRPADCSQREVGQRAVITLAGTDVSFPAMCEAYGSRTLWDELPQ